MRIFLTAALAAIVALTTMSSASAATTNSIGTLTPAADDVGINNLQINLVVDTALILPSAPTVKLDGTIGVDFTFDDVTGEITALQFNGGAFTATSFDWTFGGNPVIANTGLAGVGAGTETVAVVAGVFDSTNQAAQINQGTAIGSLLGTPVNVDFANPPGLPIPGDGAATLTQSVVADVNTWQITMPVDFFALVDSGPPLVEISEFGTVQFGGSFSTAVVIPEPTSGLFLASLACGAGAVVRRRRK